MRRVTHGVTLTKKPQVVHRKASLESSTAGNRTTSKSTVWQIASLKADAKICVIRSVGGIGDILMTMPAVKQLKIDYPLIDLTYATDRHTSGNDSYYQLIKNAPFIDSIIDARYIDRNKFDAVVDISSVCIRHEHSNLPIINRIDIFSRACGIPRLKDPLPFYSVEPEENAWARAQVMLARAQNKKLVFLHTASFDKKRCWPMQRYLELLEQSQNERPDILFLVSDFNNYLSNRATFKNVLDVSSYDIRKIAALINVSDLFIGPDSGPMHIAGALKKKAICMFGSIPPNVRINYYAHHIAVEPIPKLSCQYCIYAKCDKNFKCMSDITCKQVYDKMVERV